MPYSSHPTYGCPTVKLGGLAFAGLSKTECVDLLVGERLSNRGGWMLTANTDFLRQAYTDTSIHRLYQTAELVVADGMPVIWASYVRGAPLKKGRVCGSDLIYSLPEACARTGLSIFLLGGVGDIAERTETVLTSRFPGLRIAGKYSPPFGFEQQPEEYEAMRSAIRDAKPDFILVALGAPKSELLIQELRPVAPNAWWMGVGASFEFACGARRRAPRLMQAIGAEWMFRMLQDPGRLIKRYLHDNLTYLPILLASAFGARFFERRQPAAAAPPVSTSSAQSMKVEAPVESALPASVVEAPVAPPVGHNLQVEAA